MCGLVGFLQKDVNDEYWYHVLNSMTDRLIHRGPNDVGVWYDSEDGVGLGHRRLAIVDLSQEGHQPMNSESGRFQIVYNGEIYNFQGLKKELQSLGRMFKGYSDTEILLTAIEEWGLNQTINRLIGMFAFALWDRKEKVLHLVRDRIGEKPLYYGRLGNTFLFASELKALKKHPCFTNEINRDALSLFFKYNYIPAPYSIYKNIYKLEPGTLLTVKLRDGEIIKSSQVYWSLSSSVGRGINSPFLGTEAEAIQQLDELLTDSVKQQMIADVPIGAFLSGGIDSSLVVAIMQSLSSQPVKTFTIGFNEAGYNEANYAKAVAKHLGTDHHEFYASSQDAIDLIPRLSTLYDEPFSDSSQIPTFLVSRLARQHVTVTLSGDGGDELFGGYNRHFWGKTLWERMSGIPLGMRKIVSKCLTSFSPQTLNNSFNLLGPILPNALCHSQPGEKLHKLAGVLTAESPEAMYYQLVSHWKDPAALVIGSKKLQTSIIEHEKMQSLDYTGKMMFLDTMTYLPDDILVKVDRATMGVSLESRIPMLDHRIIEFAWRLPITMKIHDGVGKWILRQVLYKYVPRELLERPKSGFAIPIGDWLRGPLRDWCECLLSEKLLKEGGFLKAEPIRKKWEEHLSGKFNWQYELWDILMFQMWMSENVR